MGSDFAWQTVPISDSDYLLSPLRSSAKAISEFVHINIP